MTATYTVPDRITFGNSGEDNKLIQRLESRQNRGELNEAITEAVTIHLRKQLEAKAEQGPGLTANQRQVLIQALKTLSVQEVGNQISQAIKSARYLKIAMEDIHEVTRATAAIICQLLVEAQQTDSVLKLKNVPSLPYPDMLIGLIQGGGFTEFPPTEQLPRDYGSRINPLLAWDKKYGNRHDEAMLAVVQELNEARGDVQDRLIKAAHQFQNEAVWDYLTKDLLDGSSSKNLALLITFFQNMPSIADIPPDPKREGRYVELLKHMARVAHKQNGDDNLKYGIIKTAEYLLGTRSADYAEILQILASDYRYAQGILSELSGL